MLRFATPTLLKQNSNPKNQESQKNWVNIVAIKCKKKITKKKLHILTSTISMHHKLSKCHYRTYISFQFLNFTQKFSPEPVVLFCLSKATYWILIIQSKMLWRERSRHLTGKWTTQLQMCALHSNVFVQEHKLKPHWWQQSNQRKGR